MRDFFLARVGLCARARRQPRRAPPHHTRPDALECACPPAGKVAGAEGGGGGLSEERAPSSAGVHCGKEAAASRAGWRCSSGGGGGKSSRPHTAVWSRGPSPASARAPLLPLAAPRASPSSARGLAEPAGQPSSPPRPRGAAELP